MCPEDGEEGTTWPPLPKIAFGNLRNWSQRLSWGHVPGSGSRVEVNKGVCQPGPLGSWKEEEGLEELFLILFRAQKEDFPIGKKGI